MDCPYCGMDLEVKRNGGAACSFCSVEFDPEDWDDEDYTDEKDYETGDPGDEDGW